MIKAPLDLQLSNHDLIQPDLMMVTLARKQIMTPVKIEGAPELVVEILSLSNADHDLKGNGKLYEDTWISK